MDEAEKGRLSETDRWVLVAGTLIALALIAAAVISNDTSYLAYLGGPATLVTLYFIFFR
jgi:hypothetical protein